MKELFFWRVWSASERRLAISILIIIDLSLLFLLFKSINSLENVTNWNVLSELQEVNAVTDQLLIGQWQFGVPNPVQLVSEQFIASVMQLDHSLLYVFTALTIIGISFILAALTTLPRFWYLTGMVIFILLLAISRLETLQVFGDGNRTLFILTIITYGGLSYYLQAFKTSAGTALRIGIMLAASVLLACLIGLLSPVKEVVTVWVVYSYPLWLMITVLFFLMISTEIMAGLVWLTSSEETAKGKKGITNFLVISILYLIYLLIFYLKNTRQIDWDIVMLNPVYLTALSAIIGIWGFRRRADSTGGVMTYRFTGFWLYAGAMLVAISFVALAAGMANDPTLEALEDFAVEGQLAMSTVFLCYIIVNFYPLFMQGLAVHKVLYKPMRWGLTQVRLFGFTGVVILISVQKLLPLNQSIAGYFNGLGDLHTETNEFVLAEQYYKLAVQQEFQNHKSNYSLASLALKQGDRNAAAFYFRQALLKNPSPQAYVGLTTVLIDENLFFDAIYSLKEGITKFPESGELLNNLGILYTKTNLTDSAYYFVEKAERVSKRPEVAATNLLFILGKNGDPTILDSLSIENKSSDYLSYNANWLAIKSLKQDFSKSAFVKSAVPSDSLLSAASFAYLVNYGVNQARNDSTLATLLPRLAPLNPVLSQDLTFAALHAQFYSGDKLKALEILQSWVEEGGKNEQLYRKTLGHWFLQLGLYQQSIDQFSNVEGAEGSIGMAIANSLSGNDAVATIILDKLDKEVPNGTAKLLAETLQKGNRPKSISDSLVSVALKSPSARNFDLAVRSNPFDAKAVSAAAKWFRQEKQTEKAYGLVVNALRFNEYSPEIWEQYAYLSLDQGLLAQGDEAKEKVSRLADDAVYQQFDTRYQSMRALIEKQRAEFH